MVIKKGLGFIAVFICIFIGYGARAQPLGQISPQVIGRCVEYYKEAGVSPDVAFEFCGTSAGTERSKVVRYCITYYRGAGVSSDVAFAFVVNLREQRIT